MYGLECRIRALYGELESLEERIAKLEGKTPPGTVNMLVDGYEPGDSLPFQEDGTGDNTYWYVNPDQGMNYNDACERITISFNKRVYVIDWVPEAYKKDESTGYYYIDIQPNQYRLHLTDEYAFYITEINSGSSSDGATWLPFEILSVAVLTHTGMAGGFDDLFD